MANKRVFSFMAYDNHGELLGFMQHRPSGTGMVTVWKDNLPKYIYTKDIGSIEPYSVQAINRFSKEKQEAYVQSVLAKETMK